MDDQERAKDNKLDLTAAIVSAYVAKNSVPMANLPELVASVHASLASLNGAPEPEKTAPVPAVPIKKSVTQDYIISLEDGRKFKSLKRHLATHYGLTPDQYRQKWGLPADYPMVAPNYAATRSALARSIGLGRKDVAEPAVAAEAEPAKKPRRKKTAVPQESES
jgi:predicted transcriptional regulator